MNKFNIGDVVKLKSGGSAMTVIKTNMGDTVCAWHYSDGVPAVAVYPDEVLVDWSEFSDNLS